MTVVVMDTKPIEEKEERPVAAEKAKRAARRCGGNCMRRRRDRGTRGVTACGTYRNVGMQGTFTNRCASRTVGREERRQASSGRSATFGRVAGKRHRNRVTLQDLDIGAGGWEEENVAVQPDGELDDDAKARGEQRALSETNVHQRRPVVCSLVMEHHQIKTEWGIH